MLGVNVDSACSRRTVLFLQWCWALSHALNWGTSDLDVVAQKNHMIERKSASLRNNVNSTYYSSNFLVVPGKKKVPQDDDDKNKVTPNKGFKTKFWNDFVYVPVVNRDMSGGKILVGMKEVPLVKEIAELHLGDQGDEMIPESKTIQQYHTTLYIGLSGSCSLQLLSPNARRARVDQSLIEYSPLGNYPMNKGSTYLVFPGVDRMAHVGGGHECKILRVILSLRNYTFPTELGWVNASLNDTLANLSNNKTFRHTIIPGGFVKGLYQIAMLHFAPGIYEKRHKHDAASEILLTNAGPACNLQVFSQDGERTGMDVGIGTLAIVNPETFHAVGNPGTKPCQIVSVTFGKEGDRTQFENLLRVLPS